MIKKALKRLARTAGYEIRRVPAPLPPPPDLSRLENQFVRFIAARRERPVAEIERLYRETRDRFRFDSKRYFDLCEDIHYVFRVFYNDLDEKGMMESYRFFALPHIFWFIGEDKPGLEKLCSGLFAGLEGRPPRIVDYGCGLAHLSYGIAKLHPEAETTLVDIDNLKLDFAAYRFREAGLRVRTLVVDEKNPYPQLPPHNLCVATEVLEHLKDPMRALNNIAGSMEPGGILYGDFGDHDPILFHVSTDLSEVRQEIARLYDPAGEMTYRKK